MADRDRITVDIKGMREEIENAYDSEAWKALSFSSQIKTLIRERLNEIKASKK